MHTDAYTNIIFKIHIHMHTHTYIKLHISICITEGIY